MSGTLIGYARCSTDEQDLTAQRQCLAELGVADDRIYLDHGLTGTRRARPGLDQALAAVREGDTLVVPKLDRLARSVLPDVRAIGDDLAGRNIKLSLGGQVYDPTDPMGKMFFNILATFAEFEVDLLRMRTREGMAVARAKGKLRGKQPKLSPKQQAELRRMHATGDYSIADLALTAVRLLLKPVSGASLSERAWQRTQLPEHEDRGQEEMLWRRQPHKKPARARGRVPGDRARHRDRGSADALRVEGRARWHRPSGAGGVKSGAARSERGGKTSTIEILEGFRLRSAGEVKVLGVDPTHADERWRARIGIVLQSWRDHGTWQVRDLLNHLGRNYVPFAATGRARPYGADELMELVRRVS